MQQEHTWTNSMSPPSRPTITILHILSQQPGRTGSGVTLEALVQGCFQSGYEQHVIVGTDTTDPTPTVANLPASHIHPLVFHTPALNFALPGMSDVMPYKSTIFSTMSLEQLEIYRTAWKNHIQNVLDVVKPTLIHSHHIWIMSSILKDIAGGHIPIISHCHATGLRQMDLCGPALADEVQRGCARNDHFVVLHHGHKESLMEKLKVDDHSKISIVGAGFNEEIFHARGRQTQDPDVPLPPPQSKPIHLLFAGKLAHSKGLPQLLDAFSQLSQKDQKIQLHIAGSGNGEQADQLRQRMESMSPDVILHGQVDQTTLATLMRQSDVFVLPSFYEGIPLVLVEAAACGCRLVCTNLPGVMEQLAGPLQEMLEVVELPRLQTIDTPVKEELPEFVHRLVVALETAMKKSAVVMNINNKNGDENEVASIVAPFTWTAVYKRIEKVWHAVLEEKPLHN